MATSGTDLEVPPIYKAYISSLCERISSQNMTLYGTVPPFQDPGIPIDDYGASLDVSQMKIDPKRGKGKW